MRLTRSAHLALALALLASLALVSACSKKTTSPAGGGGGLELNSGNIGPGGMYAHQFNTAGNFPYRCTIHGFVGSVTVDMSAAAPVAISITDVAFNPNAVTVGKGSTVTWTNNGGTVHTVTSN